MKCTDDLDRSVNGVLIGHDWVLVDFMLVEQSAHLERVLWACPCGEFKWTGYAEWEEGQSLERGLADRKAGRMSPLSEVLQDQS